MIEVRIGRDKSGPIKWFKAAGHSGFAPHGQDIVCAGVSAIMLTAVLGLGEHLKLPVDVKSSEAEGLLECRLGEDASQDNTAQAVLETMVTGLKALAQEYPKYVKILDHS